MFQIVWMLASIAALLAAAAAAFSLICYLTLMLVRLVPLIGRRHRHRRWAELNSRRAGVLRGTPPPSATGAMTRR
jgi:hypothetical protein